MIPSVITNIVFYFAGLACLSVQRGKFDSPMAFVARFIIIWAL